MPFDGEVVLLALILLGIPYALGLGLQEMALNDAKHVVRGQIEGEIICLYSGGLHRSKRFDSGPLPLVLIFVIGIRVGVLGVGVLSILGGLAEVGLNASLFH